MSDDEQRRRFEAAYRATTYAAALPGGVVALRVGGTHSALDAFLAAAGATSWAFVSAWNPRSAPLPAEENATRQRALVAAVGALGLAAFPGVGRGDDGSPPEESLLIAGITRDAAGALGERFSQNAVVFGELGRPAELLWLD